MTDRAVLRHQCIEGVNYMYVKKSGMYLCITSRYNLSPCMILELLERLTRCALGRARKLLLDLSACPRQVADARDGATGSSRTTVV